MERDWNRLRRWIVRKRLQGWSVTELYAQSQISGELRRKILRLRKRYWRVLTRSKTISSKGDSMCLTTGFIGLSARKV